MTRLTRTVLLGAVAAVAGIWWLGRAYDVEDSRLLGYLLASLLFVAAAIVLAVVGAVVVRVLRRRRSGRPLPMSDLHRSPGSARGDP